jgi:hypothetical protein
MTEQLPDPPMTPVDTSPRPEDGPQPTDQAPDFWEVEVDTPEGGDPS